MDCLLFSYKRLCTMPFGIRTELNQDKSEHLTELNFAYLGMINGVFTLPDTDTDAETDTDAIGSETHCVGVGTSVGKGKICVDVGQCEHTIKNTLRCCR